MSTDLERFKSKWEQNTLQPFLEQGGERQDQFETLSHIPVDRLYLPPETTGAD